MSASGGPKLRSGASAFSPSSIGPQWQATIANARFPSGAVVSSPTVLTSSGQLLENSSKNRRAARVGAYSTMPPSTLPTG